MADDFVVYYGRRIRKPKRHVYCEVPIAYKQLDEALDMVMREVSRRFCFTNKERMSLALPQALFDVLEMAPNTLAADLAAIAYLESRGFEIEGFYNG